MKKLFIYTVLICAVFCSSCSEEYDDSALWNGLNSLEARVVKLEELCKQLNTNISALQTIVYALQNNDYVTGVAPITKDGEIVGYTITFTKSPSITIYHGKDGQNGADGYTPIIGVKQDVDGVYYWTLDGDWLLDADGNRIKTQGADGKDGIDGKDGKDGADGKDGVDGKDGENGTDGKDGVDGKDGEDGADGKDGVDGKDGENGTDGKDGVDGKDGKDGITPKLKIENGYWYVSYDEGSSWEKLGKATGADGQDGEDGTDGEDGEDGEDGDNIFSSVTQDDEYVYFNLSDGTIITLQKQEKENIKFEDIYVKMICCNNWDTNNDGELSYSEAAAVQNIGTVFKGNTKIVAFSELKYFTGINIIPQEAFSNCTSLWKVSIPVNVTTIEKYAFNKCSNLYNLIISEGVSKIGYGAFSWCTSLTNLTIPNSVIEIDNLAFTQCTGLKVTNIGNGIVTWGYSVFSGCTGEAICNSNIRDVTSSQGSGVFVGSSFNKVTIGGGAAKIWSYAFYDNSTVSTGGSRDNATVETLIIESSVKVIGEYAVNTSTLKNVYCKSTTPPQGASNMFYSGVKNIYVPQGAGETYKNATYWKDYASKIVEYNY